ncbi:MAG: hypothetical protein MUP09_07620 [Thiovulaceae bacterium]|nr:hypothetical protein [Sulfurimonadaceae bacterium]
MPDEIYHLETDDIHDNLLYYPYGIKHLLSLQKKGMDAEDPQYISSYRSFEGEAFENFIYERLLRWAVTQDKIVKFISKGPNAPKTNSHSDTLSVNTKGQIIYRTNRNEIGEFDALFITKDDTLFMVEMTLTKSVVSLKRRLRKKKALLETIFPHYKVKALLILNEGVTGTKQLPDFCTVWITKPFTAKDILSWLSDMHRNKRKPYNIVKDSRIIGTGELEIRPFKYYSTMTWLMKRSRSSKHMPLDMNFLNKSDVVRKIDLFTKFYIGYMSAEDFKKIAPTVTRDIPARVVVALEKEHTGELGLIYFLQYNRRNIDMVHILNGGGAKIDKKDPYGITVNEVHHVLRAMKESDKITPKETAVMKTLIKEDFMRHGVQEN